MEWTFENIIYIIAGVTFCIFAIKLLCAIIGFDFEADVDFDFGDIISFKGIVHFLMGFSGYLSIMFHNGTYSGTKDIAYAGIIGLIVMILLYFTYILIYKLDSPHKTKTGEQLVGYKGTIDFIKDKDKYLYLTDEDKDKHLYSVNVVVDMNNITVLAQSDKSYHVGDEVIISQFKDNLYLI